MTQKRSRDICRQNKATTVVAGSIYSCIAKDGINNITQMSDIVLNDEGSNLTMESQKRLKYISLQGNSSIHCIEAATKEYMKCSTYIRCGAMTIAKKAQNPSTSCNHDKELCQWSNYGDTGFT